MRSILYFICLCFLFGCNDSYIPQEKQDSIYVCRNATRIRYEWNLLNSILSNDTSNVMLLVYKDKTSPSLKEIYCTSIYENAEATEYKLVAPWLDNVILKKSDLLMEHPIRVPVSKMKKY